MGPATEACLSRGGTGLLGGGDISASWTESREGDQLREVTEPCQCTCVQVCGVTPARPAASGEGGGVRVQDGTTSQCDNLHCPGLGEK